MKKLKYESDDFRELEIFLSEPVAASLETLKETAAIIAQKKYQEHIRQSPKVCGIVTEGGEITGFAGHEGEYDTHVGYLVELEEIENS